MSEVNNFPFSNFKPGVVTYKGITFPTVENFYQAMKLPRDKWKQVSQMSPGAAKKFARNVRYRANWQTIKYKIMEYGLRQKFAPGTEAAQALLAFEGPIVEWTLWHDNDWGDCICWKTENPPWGQKPECKQPGKNNLGKLLTKIRQELASSR